VWVFVVPVGVPYFFIRLLRHYRVPEMAQLRADNAWLQEAAQLAWTMGLAQKGVKMDALDVDNIADSHLEALHAVFIDGASVERAADIFSGASPAGIKKNDPEDGATAREASCTDAAKLRAKALSGCLPSAKKTTAANRRATILHALLTWCRTSGKLAVPLLEWEEMEEADKKAPDVPAEPPAAPRGCFWLVSLLRRMHSEPAAIACSDLPRLQRIALRDVGFLFAAYHTQTWYWESVELVRKLALTSILALIAPGSAGQVVVGFIIAFVTLLAIGAIKPYAKAKYNALNCVTQINLVAFLFVALLLKVNVDNEGSASFFNVVVGCMSILPIALPLGIKAYMVFKGSSRERAISRDNAWELS
jgi:hypothetical protein